MGVLDDSRNRNIGYFALRTKTNMTIDIVKSDPTLWGEMKYFSETFARARNL